MIRFGNLRSLGSVGFWVALSIAATAVAGDTIPPCLDGDKKLPIDNEQVLDWKRSTPNQYKARAYVSGKVVRAFRDKGNHEHFEIQIGPQKGDVLEVIYNEVFGEMKNEPTVGMMIEACGDYITSTKQSGHYPPSPSGAIIHWVHFSPNTKKHEHGFVVMNGDLVGDDLSRARRD